MLFKKLRMTKKVAETFFWHYHFTKTIFPNSYLTQINPTDGKGIEDVRREYCDTCSSQVFSISQKASIVIYNLIHSLKPPVILDLGSGFTTWLCYYSIGNSTNTTIISVDSSNDWIAKNENFLTKHHIKTTISNYKTFEKSPPYLPFGSLIINDIGDPDNFMLRESSLHLLTEYIKNGAILFLDDIHKPTVKAAALQLIHDNNFYFQDLCSITFDNFGRYSWLIFSKPNES